MMFKKWVAWKKMWHLIFYPINSRNKIKDRSKNKNRDVGVITKCKMTASRRILKKHFY